MDVVWLILGGLLLAAGMIGCIVPVIPGPVVAYCGILCLLPTAHAPSSAAIWAFGALTMVAMVLDSVVPALGATKFRCSRAGVFGCVVGTVVGMFFFPLGLLLGPFLGAVAGELLAGKTVRESVWGGFGAFLGFLLGTFLKFAACAAMAVFFVKSL